MKKILICLCISFLAICGILLFLNPYNLSPLEFVPIIGTVYVFSYLAIFTCIYYFSELTNRQRLLTSAILAFTPTILCALMTLGSLAAIDVVLAVIVPVLVAWYVFRLKS